MGSYDNGLSEVQLVMLEEAFGEIAKVFYSLRKSTDRAQANLLLCHNFPDRMDMLEQSARELCRARATVEELLVLVEELQGVIDDPS